MSSKQSSFDKEIGFSEGDGGLPLRNGLRCAINFTLAEIDSAVRDMASLVKTESLSSAFLAKTDNGRLLMFCHIWIE